MPRTMVDLLKRGNQELFYSAMLAWLLDPTESHGLGHKFISGFISTARSKGFDIPEDGWGAPMVETEVRGRRSRYDIVVQCTDGNGFVIENKTKSIGALSQLEQYEQGGQLVVPLGLSAESFRGDQPSLTYFHVRDLLEDLGSVPDDGFGHLVRHFRQHLDGELERLQYVQRLAGGDLNLSLREGLRGGWESGELSTNDLRFLNLLFLNIAKQELEVGVFVGIQWRSNKNQSSGAWLASSPTQPPTGFRWAGSLLKAVEPGRAWVHIELHRGVLSAGEKETVGQIQLRAKAGEGQTNRDLYSAVRDVVSGPEIEWARRPSDSYRSFKTAYMKLEGTTLTARKLRDELIRFLEIFGTFS